MAYTIDAVGVAPERFFHVGHGVEMTAYTVGLHDVAGNVYPRVQLVQRREAPTPTVGQSIEGNLDQGRFGLVLKHAYNPDSLRGAA